MFNKNNQQNYHAALANSFDRKKTRENDIKRFQNIHAKINKLINMDLYNSETIFDGDISKLYHKNVKIINNVYQETYTENIKPTGFGDCIRGCYSLLQFAGKYNFKCKIIINHPIAEFLEFFHKQYVLYENFKKPLINLTSMFVENNWKDSIFDDADYIVDAVTNKTAMSNFVNYLSRLKVFNGNLFSYNIMFPYDEICEEHKAYMRKLLEPTEVIKLYIDNTLENIGLCKKRYSVIHIRSGDKYLNETTKIFDGAYFKRLVHELAKLINSNPSVFYLLIADNNEIKVLLMEIFPYLKAVYKNITHLGDGTLLETEKVKNTLLDFYLMSHSNSIHSFTCYAHGSGFSYWCAKTYNVPHKCMYICV